MHLITYDNNSKVYKIGGVKLEKIGELLVKMSEPVRKEISVFRKGKRYLQRGLLWEHRRAIQIGGRLRSL